MNAGLTVRLKTLCSLLFRVKTFADVGCDHGYCTRYMLENELCERATITDISAECLKKAETLLREYIRAGRCDSLCTNGLKGVDENVDLVLISGMGGMEIVHILTGEGGFVPKNFVLQPMRDARAVRETLLSRGARIERDFTFFDGKYYEVISGSRSEEREEYTQAELDFGKENIRKPGVDFGNFLREEIGKKKNVLSRPLSDLARVETEEKIKYLQGVLSGEIK